MKFRLGPPPIDDTILKDDNAWCLLDEPADIRFQVYGVLVALLITAALILVLLARDPKYVMNISWPIVILFIFIVMPIHEFLHAISFPGGAISKDVAFGFYPRAFAFYAHYSGIITRHRHILISIFPFIMLTLIPLTVVLVMKLERSYLVEIILAGGLASAGDVLTILYINKHVPRGSILINSGLKTYWKQMDNIRLQNEGAGLN